MLVFGRRVYRAKDGGTAGFQGGAYRFKLADRAQLFVIKGGDHSFHVLKSLARSDDEVLDEIVITVAKWMKTKA